jgi:hypothetical protein
MFYCQDSVHVDGGVPEYIFDYRRPQNDSSLGVPHSEEHESHRKWRIIIERYSSIDLSMPSDRLPAISAVAKTFEATLSNSSTLHKSYKAGLWEQHFPLNRL